jgi:hypothetical protein
MAGIGYRTVVGKLLGSHPLGRQEENGWMALGGLIGTHYVGRR